MTQKTKEVLTSVALRFGRVWLAAWVVLIPVIPQELNDIKGYLQKIGIAAIIAFLVASDKLIREVAANIQK